ncbi:hypothetical protein PPYR_09611 [Photinus pyralis]|uniref:Transmembrane protein 268 n=1 Tax=Photinus pyralis TaxID=7054 RepID=A0A1Y1L678_PHOPY|nr:uncharacterized protein LOC116170973 isoform X2 [Photinus pyralis]KAB0798618.1 hypothetical protein PPYR_09611 [Photinus pyralis]
MGSNNIENKPEIGQEDAVPSLAQQSPKKGWIKFEEESHQENNTTPAVIKTESIQVNLERSLSASTENDPNKPLRTVELPPAANETIRHGFTNGDVIVTILPVNTRFPWITPAKFRPELVPEELMAQGLTLTVEEYVQAMELLVNDVRFTLYNVCYKRILVVWILLAFIVLLGLLFSGLNGLVLFGLGVAWLILNAAAIFISMWLKFKLARNLERCLAYVNKQFLRHKIVLALDDRGKLSCHKVNLCFLYMDAGPCIAHLQGSIETQEREANGWEQRMDIAANDIVIQGSRTTRLSRKQERSTLLYLRYVARWGRQVVKGSINNSPLACGRHCPKHQCPCQFIDEHLHCKPKGYCLFCTYIVEGNVQHNPLVVTAP